MDVRLLDWHFAALPDDTRRNVEAARRRLEAH